MSSPTPKSPRRAVGGPALARYALAVGSAAIIAYGVTVFPSFRDGRGSDRANSDLSLDGPKLHLEWIAKADSLQPAKPAISQPNVTGVAVKPMDPDEVASLMQRGRDLLRNGDISLAQLAFRRLADAGIAEGALALATTYDPRYLAEHNFIGLAGDETKARNWYQRARELGSAEADHILTHTEH